MANLRIEPTPMPGLLVVHLPVHSDNRGWFKENWQRENMVALGLPDFSPVQNNVSYNVRRGATRGIHAEPWDKIVSVATGRIFGAWVDLRAGETFGRVFTLELGPETTVFVPRGVGNAYQTLEDATSYSYLVNDHWSPQARDSYTFVNLADPSLAISWPISLDHADVSEADRSHPEIANVKPVPALRPLVLGAGGQVGRALCSLLPDAHGVTRAELDLTARDLEDALEWGRYDVIYNAAAYNAVDEAETPQGRREAWRVNVGGTARLVEAARHHGIPLVHFSTDYVFDGVQQRHDEYEPMSPLGVYGQTKAAADALVTTLSRHYILRTSWVIGDGGNFVKTMARLADQGVSPLVVCDQVGRLSFADELARAARHLVTERVESGTYNVTCSGEETSWAEIAAEVFRAKGRDPKDVTPVSTEEYVVGKQMAPRPRQSTLELNKLESIGFRPTPMAEALAAYVKGL